MCFFTESPAYGEKFCKAHQSKIITKKKSDMPTLRLNEPPKKKQKTHRRPRTRKVFKEMIKQLQKDLPKNSYFVEKILDERMTSSGRKEYHVKWLNYDESTWEPELNLSKELIHKYNNSEDLLTDLVDCTSDLLQDDDDCEDNEWAHLLTKSFH